MSEIPDFHVPEHDSLPLWHPERAACATCHSDEEIEARIASKDVSA